MIRRTNDYVRIASQRGLTLVELMVSLVLSLVLMLGAMQLFSSSKQTYQLSDSLARVQENGRFALDLIVRDLRLGGYTGCKAELDFSNLLTISDPAAPEQWAYDFARPVFAYDGGDTDSPVTFPTAPSSGSAGAAWVLGNANDEVPDSVVSLFVDPALEFIVNQVPADAASAVAVFPTGEVSRGDYVVITDCDRAALFRVTDLSTDSLRTLIGHSTTAADGVSETPENCSERLHDSCGSGVVLDLLKPYGIDVSHVAPLRARGYYIGDTGRSDVAGNPVPALYVHNLNRSGLESGVNDPVEMVEGVVDLQLEYGLSAVGADDRSARSYLRADEVSAITTDDAWQRVVSVRVLLTVRSVADPAVTRDFSAIVAVRNRTL